ncbi:MAG: cobalamin biosynthesis protein [Lachnospiraceae bacterium]|nr:cobalamin biosynthesis protein [Lachnospiraceae bacterium]
MAFTNEGKKLASRMKDLWTNHVVEVFDGTIPRTEWVKEGFDLRIPMVFIGACGIAVRTIAPFLQDKLTDPAILVMDEAGEYVIPILSGHVGGANALSREVEALMGAKPVITTATDVQKKCAMDVIARKNGFRIVNRSQIAVVAKKALEGYPIKLLLCDGITVKEPVPEGIMCFLEQDHAGGCKDMDVILCQTIPEGDFLAGKNAPLVLQHQELILGIGCKKGTVREAIDTLVLEALSNISSSMDAVAGIATIDLKKREYGLLAFGQSYGKDIYTYDAETLKAVSGTFAESKFVEEITGVGNVCERAALKAAGEGAMLISPKLAKNGVTVAIARRKGRIETWE